MVYRSKVGLFSDKDISYSQRRSNIIIFNPKEYSKEQPMRTAIIVMPGGSYYYLAINSEGKKVAKELANRGYVAVALRYSIGFFGGRYPEQIEGYRAAYDYLKRNYKELNIDTTKIGVLGFSAGGHLAGCALLEEDRNYRAAFAGLIYPVITLSKPYAHQDSKRYLLRGNLSLQKSLSLEDRLGEYISTLEAKNNKLSPLFLLHCQDDNTVDVRGSKDFADTLKNSRLGQYVAIHDTASTDTNHKYLIYFKDKGGHGFGLGSKKRREQRDGWRNIAWIDLFDNWLNYNGFGIKRR